MFRVVYPKVPNCSLYQLPLAVEAMAAAIELVLAEGGDGGGDGSTINVRVNAGESDEDREAKRLSRLPNTSSLSFYQVEANTLLSRGRGSGPRLAAEPIRYV